MRGSAFGFSVIPAREASDGDKFADDFWEIDVVLKRLDVSDESNTLRSLGKLVDDTVDVVEVVAGELLVVELSMSEALALSKRPCTLKKLDACCLPRGCCCTVVSVVLGVAGAVTLVFGGCPASAAPHMLRSRGMVVLIPTGNSRLVMLCCS
jgi:hypothetical protein